MILQYFLKQKNMKKLLALLVVIFYIFNSNVSAYSIINVSNNSIKYEALFKQKLDFSKIKTITLEKLNKKIELLIKNTEEDNKKEDSKKEKLLWQLIALSNLVNTELTNRTTISNLTITIIDDKRCTNCGTNEFKEQIKRIPFLMSANIIEKDFSEDWVQDYLKQNDIKKLPAIILSTNKINDNWEMQVYLKELKDKQYTLEIGSSFDPFATRSIKWFLVLDKELLNKIKENTYLKWNKDAKISWIEYSDLECPFCAKLHNEEVPKNIKEMFKDEVNIYFNNYPLWFHKNAMNAARVLECLWDQKWGDAFYNLIETSFTNEKSDKEYLVEEAVKLWADKVILEKCISDWKFDEKINAQQSLWASTFWVTWTPASILINNETGEYEIISWAYPLSEFVNKINSLLK